VLPSKAKHKSPSPELQRLLRAAYDYYQKLDDRAANAEARLDFVFHMTDWIADLERLAALYARPEEFDKHTASGVVFDFLIHALGHLLAASRLLLNQVSDPFAAMEDQPSSPLTPAPRPRRRAPSP
jgi:hypothetical protein